MGGFAGSIVLARLLDDAQGLDGFEAVFVKALAAAVASVACTRPLPARPPIPAPERRRGRPCCGQID